jgi:hypothetical protein
MALRSVFAKNDLTTTTSFEGTITADRKKVSEKHI